MSILASIRRYLTKERVDIAQSLGGLNAIGDVITTDISAAALAVTPGHIMRIQLAGDTYITFSDQNIASAVDVNTTPAIKLAAGYHYLLISGAYVRASANPTRIEIIA